MFKRVLALLLAVLTLATLAPSALAEEKTMYVNTKPGRKLNVRSYSEAVDGVYSNVLDELPRGTAVKVYYSINGWSQIEYYWMNGTEVVPYAFVMTRYLSDKKPSGSKKTSKSSSKKAQTKAEKAAKAQAKINAELASARLVATYTVVARPSHASGWVNLRKEPSTRSQRLGICRKGKELLVMAELKNWYQVQDPATGMIGYISKSFVKRK